MNKLLKNPTLFTATLILIALVNLPSLALAHANILAQADSGRPSVRFDQSQATPGESTTGFTDKNGKPLTREEYAKIREDMSKGIFEKQPVLTGVIVLAIIGAIYYFGFYRRKTAKK